MIQPPPNHVTFLRQVPATERRALTRLSDTRGLRHLAGHMAFIAIPGSYVAFGLPLWGLALVPLGIGLAFLFTLQHECTHRTPFKSRWLNEAIGHATGLILFQPFLWFRAFHMAHHKHTNDPDHDPELSDGGGMPQTRAALLWHLATPAYWTAKAKTLVNNATGPAPTAYLGPKQIRKAQLEARAYLAIYALAALAMVTKAPWLFWVWLVPLALGFPVLRLYLLAEHGRCAQVTNMFANSRTTYTNAAIRALAWNMPYHAEHHAWPSVPFHRLPDLHNLTAPHLQHTTDGYGTFTAQTWQATTRSP